MTTSPALKNKSSTPTSLTRHEHKSNLCTREHMNVQHAQTITHTHTHTPSSSIPLCSPWDHLTLSTRLSQKQTQLKGFKHTENDANQAVVKAHSRRIHLQMQNEPRGGNSQSTDQTRSSGEWQQEQGIVGHQRGGCPRNNWASQRLFPNRIAGMQGCKRSTGEHVEKPAVTSNVRTVEGLKNSAISLFQMQT